MTRWLALVAYLVSTSMALAGTIGIRAGEHSGFSRIVLDGAGAYEWTIGRTETGYGLQPNDADVDFNVGRALRDLRGGRVKDLTADGSTLFITLDCDCVLKSYALGG
ncbi:MAG: hypothetical protein ABI459_10615, partial [Deltaproteobacteria bacterium]